jgi:hypothetical protein
MAIALFSLFSGQYLQAVSLNLLYHPKQPSWSFSSKLKASDLSE